MASPAATTRSARRLRCAELRMGAVEGATSALRVSRRARRRPGFPRKRARSGRADRRIARREGARVVPRRHRRTTSTGPCRTRLRGRAGHRAKSNVEQRLVAERALERDSGGRQGAQLERSQVWQAGAQPSARARKVALQRLSSGVPNRSRSPRSQVSRMRWPSRRPGSTGRDRPTTSPEEARTHVENLCR